MRRRLGSGGFATVWLAHDEQLDAEVAVKVLAENWAHDDAVRRRFLEEGRFLRRVESEHVVQVHDVGELEDGRPFLVLTYADRGTLADRLKKEPLALADAVGVVVQVGRGLQALHRRGLLHRDVKPANVLFRSTDEGERAVLSDLGLGKSLDEVSRITMPGGTPSYVAPEQAMGERLDERADQYSLGAVAYAALTGRSPHQVDGLGAAGRVHAPAPPSSLGFDIPDKIDEAIVRALDPDRANRWPDVATFTRELVGALDETTHGFVPASVSGLPTQQVTVDRSAVDSPTERPPSEAPTELPSAEAVTTPVPVGADPEPTAPSDANAPTLLKPGEEAGSGAGADSARSPESGSVQAGGGVGSAGVDAAAPGAQPAAPAAGASASGVAPAAQAASPAGGSAVAPAAPGSGAASIAPLASIAASTDDIAPSDQPARTGRRRGRWVVAFVLALLLGGAAGFSYQRYVEPRTMGELPAHSTVQRN
ncbi:serine/threonine-protein kinase [Kribbella sp. ALI-6-A]|uniref:serine/threonine-protein kinase n=1 Tax=Kribbella sp. ALI-6-A TaxID=1933817 RepID=UPI001EDAEE24|nr:serine/threonine-protein kinase [Kribbella sp. ALI-6-A]